MSTFLRSIWNREKLPQQIFNEMNKKRQVFPCYFGSALKLQGIQEFLEGLDVYTKCPEYGEAFAARVFKISRDEKGNRLTHLKVTGGTLKVKQIVQGKDWEEKANQIRVYDGAGFSAVNEAISGKRMCGNRTFSYFCRRMSGRRADGKRACFNTCADL